MSSSKKDTNSPDRQAGQASGGRNSKAAYLSPAQGALLGCIRSGPKLRKQLSWLRSSTWSNLSRRGYLIARYDGRENDFKFSITEAGKAVYDAS